MNTKTQHWASIAAGILSLAGYASAASLGSEKYTYDSSGNIIEKSIDGKVTKMSFNASNKLQYIQSSGNPAVRLGYDSQGRPDSYLDKDGMSSGQMNYGYMDKVLQTKSSEGKATFLYDADGRLVGKSVGGAVTSYIWDGNVLAAEGVRVFTNEAHAVGGVSIIAEDQNVVISDYLGSTLSEGSRQFCGTAYGEGLESVRFTGKPFVEELGNFVFPYRLYSPIFACWTVSDPSGFPNGKNNNLYTSGDPLSRFDPDGLTWVKYKEVRLDPLPFERDSPVAPSGSGWWIGDEETTELDAYLHSSWVHSNTRYGAAGQPLKGSHSYSCSVTADFSVDAKFFKGGGSVTVSSGALDAYDYTLPKNEKANIHASNSKGNHDEWKQDWEWYGGTWNLKGGPYYSRALNLGCVYKTSHGLEEDWYIEN